MNKFLKISYKVIIRLVTFLPFLILITVSLIKAYYWYFRNFILYGFEMNVYDDKVNPATIGQVYRELLDKDKL